MAATLTVNGAAHLVNADPARSLLSVLRDDLKLTGAKYGCGEGQCGACTVLIDGQPTRSCITEVGDCTAKRITTIEGPFEFRLKNTSDERLRAVLIAAAEKFGWQDTKPAEGRGFGIAGSSDKGSYVATCAEVAVDRNRGKVHVVRAVTAFECGAIVNPQHLENQIEGAVMMGLGGALFEVIEFDGGKITNASFGGYRVPRFADLPELETVLVNRPDLPSAGAGETPIIAIAPAIGNAIFHATGQRLRSLPLATKGWKA